MNPDDVNVKVKVELALDIQLDHHVKRPFEEGDMKVTDISYHLSATSLHLPPDEDDEMLIFLGNQLTKTGRVSKARAALHDDEIPDDLRDEWLAVFRAKLPEVLRNTLSAMVTQAQVSISPVPLPPATSPAPQPFSGQAQKVQIPQPPGSVKPEDEEEDEDAVMGVDDE
jgi:hypothetical protein